MSFVGRIGAMDSIAIVLTGPETREISVPDLIGPFLKANSLRFLPGFGSVEQAQFDRSSVF